MRYFKVLYDFAASEAVELSVRKGETVTCSEVVERDGWLKVEMATDTRRKGFVPVSYLKEMPAPAPIPVSSMPPTPQAQGTPQRVASSSPTTAGLAPLHRTDSAANRYGEQQYRANSGLMPSDAANTTIISTQGSGFGVGGPSQSSASGGVGIAMTPADYATNPAAVVDAFMKNEVFFKQLMKQRQEALSKMESALSDATADVASCKDKNAVLARKLRDLDQQTEKERRKWKERVEEEKLSIQRAAAAASNLYGPSVESRTVRITDTYSERVPIRN